MFTVPVIDVKTDPLDALLYGLGVRLSFLTKNPENTAYHSLIKDKEIAILFKSDSMARYYRFVGGKFGQAMGDIKNADLTIEFKDSMTGVKLLGRGDIASFMTAVQDGDVKISGDYKLVLWFVNVAKHATNIPEPYKSYVKSAKPYLKKAENLAKKWLPKKK